MATSLYTLFTRSRYCRAAGPAPPIDRPEDSEEERRAREERERFAAAAICFCARHDVKFRTHFLSKICGLPHGSDWNVHLEPRRWSDLLVSAKDSKLVHVIECKISAGLKPHQNPNENAFWEKGGYGHLMREHYSKNTAELCYTVLGFPDRLYFPLKKNNITLSQLFWADLEDGLPNSDLAQDLAETLGRLGCADFTMRTIRKIRVSAGFVDALKAKLILANVRRKLKIHSRYHKDDENWDGDSASLGCWIASPSHQTSIAPIASNASTRMCYWLQRVANRDEEWIVWFGYEAGTKVERGFLRSIWLLCADAGRVDTICRAFPEELGICTHSPDDQRAAVITPPPKSKAGDLDWFVAALEAASVLDVLTQKIPDQI